MTDELATRAHDEHSHAPAQAQSLQTPAQGDRLQWLFREALRRQQVHPLMELLRRYRSQEDA